MRPGVHPDRNPKPHLDLEAAMDSRTRMALSANSFKSSFSEVFFTSFIGFFFFAEPVVYRRALN